jgi:hypothetical protein
VAVVVVGLDIGGIWGSGGGLVCVGVEVIARDARVLAVNSDLWSGSSKSSDDESSSSALSDGGEGGNGSGERGLLTLALGIGSGEGGLLTLALGATLDCCLW